MNDLVIEILRQQAWSRAKGELDAFLGAFAVSDGAKTNQDHIVSREKFDHFDSRVRQFVKEIEEWL